MKKKLLVLIVLIMSMQTIISQIINIPLSQKKEVIKGLKQGKDLKVTVKHLQELIEGLKTTIKQDSLLLVGKDKIIDLLEHKDNEYVLKLKEKDISYKKEKAILKDKFKKRFSFGFSVGAAIKDYNSFEVTPYIGLGINYRIFRF